jgi:hypothetical protein
VPPAQLALATIVQAYTGAGRSPRGLVVPTAVSLGLIRGSGCVQVCPVACAHCAHRRLAVDGGGVLAGGDGFVEPARLAQGAAEDDQRRVALRLIVVTTRQSSSRGTSGLARSGGAGGKLVVGLAARENCPGCHGLCMRCGCRTATGRLIRG